MEMPKWSEMDQKQRIMAIAAGVVGLLAILLIARGLLGGGGDAAPPPPEAIQSLQSAVDEGLFKEPPPSKEPEVVKPEGSGKRPMTGE